MILTNIVRDSVRGTEVVNLKDYFLSRRTLLLTEEVTSETMTELILGLLYLESEDNSSEITLLINSPGGDTSSGLALFDLLRAARSPVRTVCIGIAASMAGILFLAGDKREMLPHTRLMLHDPSISYCSVDNLKPHEPQRRLIELDKVRKDLTDIVSQSTGKSTKILEKMTREDCFFSAQEAVEFGLATGIADLSKKQEEDTL